MSLITIPEYQNNDIPPLDEASIKELELKITESIANMVNHEIHTTTIVSVTPQTGYYQITLDMNPGDLTELVNLKM